MPWILYLLEIGERRAEPAALIHHWQESIRLSSRAICLLKLNRFEAAKQDCDSALQLEPGNKKAFYRRALAYKGLQVPDTSHHKRLFFSASS